jgi:hypothetical protein
MADSVSLLLAALLAQAPSPSAEVAALQSELRRLQGSVASLEAQMRQRDDVLEGMKSDLQAVGAGVTDLRSRPAIPPSAPFAAAPPASSDAVGVAKTVVFAPRVVADTAKNHDAVTLKIRRLEASGARLIAEKELASEDGVELPVDLNGALYVVDWSTTEGQSYNLLLRDGTSGLTTATVQVKLQQSQGKFIYVGYRAE